MSSDKVFITVPPPVVIDVTAPQPIVVDVATGGTRGLSAYQVAVANGFGGTEAEWLSSLSSGGITPGPGFALVGAELRYNLTSLTKG